MISVHDQLEEYRREDTMDDSMATFKHRLIDDIIFNTFWAYGGALQQDISFELKEGVTK